MAARSVTISLVTDLPWCQNVTQQTSSEETSCGKCKDTDRCRVSVCSGYINLPTAKKNNNNIKKHVLFCFGFELLGARACWFTLYNGEQKRVGAWRNIHFCHTWRPCSWRQIPDTKLMAALMVIYRYLEYELSITQYAECVVLCSIIPQYAECVVLCSIIPASFSVKLIFCIALSTPLLVALWAVSNMIVQRLSERALCSLDMYVR